MLQHGRHGSPTGGLNPGRTNDAELRHGTRDGDLHSARSRARSNADLARRLAAAGAAVFPCSAGGPAPRRPMPGVLWRSSRPDGVAGVERVWACWPDGMPAITLVTTRGRILVVDADGPDNVIAWHRLARPHGGFDASVVETPSGGWHVYYRLPDGIEHGNGRGPMPPRAECPIDIRGAGAGYAIASGAVHDDGVHEPDGGDVLAWLDAPETRGWLLYILKGDRRRREGSPPHLKSFDPAAISTIAAP